MSVDFLFFIVRLKPKSNEFVVTKYEERKAGLYKLKMPRSISLPIITNTQLFHFEIRSICEPAKFTLISTRRYTNTGKPNSDRISVSLCADQMTK